MRPFASPRILLNAFKTVSSRGFSTTLRAPLFGGPPKMVVPKVAAGLALATSIGVGTPWLCKTIYNDAIVDVKTPPGSIQVGQESGLPSREPSKTASRVRARLDYKQLCYGSIFGVFLGVVVGKISSLLVFLTASAYLALQFLQNRGVVDKNATKGLLQRWTVNTATESVDLNTLVWERPCFKISFLLTFVLAAINI
ncbi:FUN14 (YAL008W) [Zygosaccharomyces parabailii]|nr:FUN14 (YAL008W) [Zygosaccharomyces parabailii]CDH12309.1 uncharacterized protein ZBAI_04095 [Zygosaccharomyces bailii ISA1307]